MCRNEVETLSVKSTLTKLVHTPEPPTGGKALDGGSRVAADANMLSGEKASLATGKTPYWMDDLLAAKFFEPCASHRSKVKNESNYFCTGCTESPLCRHCLSHGHCTGICFQIRRYMYQNVVHVVDLAKYYDLDGIQAYCINQKRAVLLSPKPLTRHGAAVPAFDHSCAACEVPLRPDCTFCSLQCKVMHDRGESPSTPYPVRRRLLSVSSDDSCGEGSTPRAISSKRRRQSNISVSTRVRRRARKNPSPVRSYDF